MSFTEHFNALAARAVEHLSAELAPTHLPVVEALRKNIPMLSSATSLLKTESERWVFLEAWSWLLVDLQRDLVVKKLDNPMTNRTFQPKWTALWARLPEPTRSIVNAVFCGAETSIQTAFLSVDIATWRKRLF